MITVIIPTFGRSRQLQMAIESVRGQTRFDDLVGEIIVVDDGSREAIQIEEGAKLRVIRHAENRGPAAARNTGCRAAAHDFLAFLDSDDVWLPDKLAVQYGEALALGSREDLARTAFVCSYVYKSRSVSGLEVRTPVGASSTAEFLRGCWTCSGSTLMVHRSAYDRVGHLDEGLRRLEDFDWFIRFGRQGGRLQVCDTVGSLIRPSYSQDLADVRQSAQGLINRHVRLGSPDRLPARERRLLMAYLNLELGVADLIAGRRLSAAAHFGWSLLERPRLSAQVDRLWRTGLPVPAAAERLHARMVEQAKGA